MADTRKHGNCYKVILARESSPTPQIVATLNNVDPWLTSENLVVLLSATGGVHPKYGETFNTALAKPLDWSSIINTSLRNRVLVRVFNCLQQRASIPVTFGRMAALYELKLTADTARLKTAFEKALPSIVKHNRIILLRGIANAYTIHKTRPVRELGDIDLLIDRPLCPSVSGVFDDHHHVPSDIDTVLRPFIEYHHDLNTHQPLGRKVARMDMALLWKRGSQISISQYEVGILAPEDTFIYLSFHNFCKGFVGLYRFIDMIDLIKCSELNWSEIVNRAHDSHLARAVAVNCFVLDALWPGIIPQSVTRDLELSRIANHVLGRLFDIRLLVHDPNPAYWRMYPSAGCANRDARTVSGRASLYRQCKKKALCIAAIIRFDNAVNIALNVITAPLLSWYTSMFHLRSIGPAFRRLRSMMQTRLMRHP